MKRLSIVLILCFFMISCAGDMTNLFSEAKVNGKLDPAKKQIIIRQRYVNIDLSLLMNADGSPKLGNKPLKLKLNLFDDVTLTAVIVKTESVQPGGLSFIGHVEGIEQSSVILSVYNGVMSGNISLSKAFYQVRYVGEGLHAIYQVDQSAFPPELPPIPVYDTGKEPLRK
jgi:hypothetical protein